MNASCVGIVDQVAHIRDVDDAFLLEPIEKLLDMKLPCTMPDEELLAEVPPPVRKKRTPAAKKKAEELLEELATGFDKTDSGLRYQIIQKGDGAKAEKGNTVSVHYKGSLPDGTVFDSSYKRNQPIDFPLGMGHVIPGWDEGIALLQVGDKARFVIPPYLGYGERGAGGVIKPYATLIFDVELISFK